MDTIFTVYEKLKGNPVIIPMETNIFVLAPTHFNPIHHIVPDIIDRPLFSRKAENMQEIRSFFRAYTRHPFEYASNPPHTGPSPCSRHRFGIRPDMHSTDGARYIPAPKEASS